MDDTLPPDDDGQASPEVAQATTPPAPVAGLVLVVDNREKPVIDQMVAVCASYNTLNQHKKDFMMVSFTVEPLDLADAILRHADGTIAWFLERKTLADLAASIGDQRHKSQSLRLIDARASNDAKVEMVYEIPPAKRHFLSPSCSLIPFPGTNIAASALRGAVNNGEVRDGFLSKYTDGHLQTAEHLVSRLVYGRKFINQLSGPRSSEQFEEEQLSIVLHKKRKNCNGTDQTCFADMLNAAKGVGPKRALTIARHYHSMANLVQALACVTPVLESSGEAGAKKAADKVFKDAQIAGIGADTAMSVYYGIYGLNE